MDVTGLFLSYCPVVIDLLESAESEALPEFFTRESVDQWLPGVTTVHILNMKHLFLQLLKYTRSCLSLLPPHHHMVSCDRIFC
jgi:hypothetical protein